MEDCSKGITPDRNWRNATSAELLRNKLGREYISWLQQWDKPYYRKARVDEYDIIMVHDKLPGTSLSLQESQDAGLGGLWKGRIATTQHARRNFLSEAFNLLIHGHTHVPAFWEHPEHPHGFLFEPENNSLKVRRYGRNILCPGSMCNDSGVRMIPGFPVRRGDATPTNTYAVLDTRKGEDVALWTVYYHRLHDGHDWRIVSAPEVWKE